jgi:hypothetical protein
MWCVWLACLPGGPCLLQNWFWGGAAESWKPEALQIARCVIYHISWDYLWVAYEMLRQQHEAIYF